MSDPTVCSESCVGRIRYIGVLLYDAEKIREAASCINETGLYTEQLKLFLDPADPEIAAEAFRQGISHAVLEAARHSPVYKMAIDWKVAFPLHPEYRTLPMVWYVPSLSPVVNAAVSGKTGLNGILPDVEDLRIPNKYLANLFTAGEETPVINALKKMLAMRAYMRSKTVDQEINLTVLEEAGLTPGETEKMYELMAIANYEERYVIPASHRTVAEDLFGNRASCGFPVSDGNREENKKKLFGGL